MHKIRALLFLTFAGTVATVFYLTLTRPTPSSPPPMREVSVADEASKSTVGVAPDSVAAVEPAAADEESVGPRAGRPKPGNGLAPIGSQWSSAPAESPFGRFAEWARRYQQVATAEARAELEGEGMQLA